jgi:hypothetical protein
MAGMSQATIDPGLHQTSYLPAATGEIEPALRVYAPFFKYAIASDLPGALLAISWRATRPPA